MTNNELLEQVNNLPKIITRETINGSGVVVSRSILVNNDFNTKKFSDKEFNALDLVCKLQNWLSIDECDICEVEESIEIAKEWLDL